ncbi:MULTISPECIES: hypothetical protein [unclassified Streptomyces]|uniref:hypothetical protein n=1 Tax=unclassified Streptomyces TaxID=2593676 RepID=UPI000B89782E|nr:MULTISPECIES: hypothetical protein [unclassified Streptomyces]MYT18066.1 hypothetical protein [Streptomyces sp. SID4951]
MAVVLLAGGGFLAWSMLGGGNDAEARQGQGQSQRQSQGQSQGQGENTPEGAKLAIPEVVKSTPAELRYDAKATAQMYPPAKRDPSSYPELKGLAQVDSVYHPENNPSVILGVHTGGGTVSNAAQRVQEAFAPNEMAVAPKDFDLQDPTRREPSCAAGSPRAAAPISPCVSGPTAPRSVT